MSQPTVVLVHGAFAESASWNGVLTRLQAAGLSTIAVANPLRSLSGDAAHVRAVLDTVEGPVVLVGHSYGGAVISAAARDSKAVRALVFIAASAAGADVDAARIRSRLRDLGVHRRRSPVRAAPEHGLQALTRAELQVVELVAAGGTNRRVAEQLFLSPHTVNTHLRNAFLKLGVRSRVELARLVAAHGAG